MVENVKLYPDLAAAAIKAGLHKELMLWSQLRAINETGSGRIRLAPAMDCLVALFGYSRPTLYRILRAGDGLFWEVQHQDPANIRLRGLAELVAHLQVRRLRAPVLVPIGELRTRQGRNAWLFTAHHGPSWAKLWPISRQSLQEATGTHPRTQRRYDRLTHTTKVANFAVMEQDGVLVPVTQEIQVHGRTITKHKRLGNSYHSQADGAPRGLAHRIHATLRLRSYNKGEAPGTERRYYGSAKALARASEAHRAALPLFRVPDQLRVIPGRVEWCYA